jgi:hypothetical protein
MKMDDCDDGSDDDIVRKTDRSNDRVMVIMTMEVLMVLTLIDTDSDTVAMMFVISVMARRMMVGGVDEEDDTDHDDDYNYV